MARSGMAFAANTSEPRTGHDHSHAAWARWRAVSSTPAGVDARVDWLVELSHGPLRNGLCGQHFRAQDGPCVAYPIGEVSGAWIRV